MRLVSTNTRRILPCLLGVGGLLTLLAGPARGGSHAPFAAREGEMLARAAASAWAGDAELVYVENDENVDDAGASARWGYLFHSASLRRNRAYSVRDGRIVVAENLELKFESPAVDTAWIDSARALAAADEGPGKAYRKAYGGRVTTMLLTRAVFSEGDPDETTWTIVYSAPHAASLFVLVDAAGGHVRRTWRG